VELDRRRSSRDVQLLKQPLMPSPATLTTAIEPDMGEAPWPGHEYVRGWGVFGLPFDSRHVLALRVFPQSSFGPYRTLWHRAQDHVRGVGSSEHHDRPVAPPGGQGDGTDDEDGCRSAATSEGRDCFRRGPVVRARDRRSRQLVDVRKGGIEVRMVVEVLQPAWRHNYQKAGRPCGGARQRVRLRRGLRLDY
jgi:hypothetical protein